jgi:hypothetical protein
VSIPLSSDWYEPENRGRISRLPAYRESCAETCLKMTREAAQPRVTERDIQKRMTSRTLLFCGSYELPSLCVKPHTPMMASGMAEVAKERKVLGVLITEL